MKTIADDKRYTAELNRLYDKALLDIDKQLKAFMNQFSGSDNVSMIKARKRITKKEMDEFKLEAESLLEDKQLTDRANEEARKELQKRKVNKLDILLATAALSLISLSSKEEVKLVDRIQYEVVAEYKRQAVLSKVKLSPEDIRRFATKMSSNSYRDYNFSDNIWANQAELKAELDKVVRRVLINGENPKTASNNLDRLVKESFSGKKGSGGARYAAERIARTESALAQSISQIESFKQFGIDKMQWVAEVDSCPICSPLDGKVFKVENIDDLSVRIPVHPSCRCSYSAYVD